MNYEEEKSLNDYREVLSKAQFGDAVTSLETTHVLIEYFDRLQLNCNQYAYIINVATMSIPAAKGFDSCLGYKNEDITIDNIHGIIHPDDRVKMKEVVVAAWEHGISLQKVKPFELQFSTDYRVIKKDGSIIRVNRHSTISEVDSAGKMVSTVSICSDITHLKTSTTITAKMFGPYRVENFNKRFGSDLKTEPELIGTLSVRELEILRLIGKGYGNKEIAQQLILSPKTTETHRKNIQKKLDINTLVKLVVFAKENNIT
ncbi:MAG: LuxR C-terminal-related transcriptional regulator [Bacteroidia bacterium]